MNTPEKWGFASLHFTITHIGETAADLNDIGNQVTPFGLQTPDGESIYAWHIMPLPLYLQNEATVSTQTPGYSEDFTSTESFRLLKEDPEARVVLYCKLSFSKSIGFEEIDVLISSSSWRKAHKLVAGITLTNS